MVRGEWGVGSGEWGVVYACVHACHACMHLRVPSLIERVVDMRDHLDHILLGLGLVPPRLAVTNEEDRLVRRGHLHLHVYSHVYSHVQPCV